MKKQDSKKQLDGVQVLMWFAVLSRIARASGHEQDPDGVSDHLENFARNHRKDGIHYERYPNGNIHMWADATPGYEKAKGVLIQGHGDMVGVKLVDGKQVPYNGPVELIEEDGWIRANNTSLGADDGMGVAGILAIFQHINDFPHGPIGALITVDEEVGMTGARDVDPLIIKKYHYLINVDAENWPKVFCGSGGGKPGEMRMAINREEIPGCLVTVKANGFVGKHSGIFPGNKNAIKYLFKALMNVHNKMPFYLGAIDGGAAPNAIPSSCEIQVVIPEGEDVESFLKYLKEEKDAIITECATTDPNATINPEKGEPGSYWAIMETEELLNWVAEIPSEVTHYKGEDPQTAVNLGRLTTFDKKGAPLEFVSALFLIRGTKSAQIAALYEKFECLASKFMVEILPGDQFDEWDGGNTELCKMAIDVIEKMFKIEIEGSRYLAGLECSEFMKHNPELQMIATGPWLEDVHTTDEKVNIKSVFEWFAFILRLIETIAEAA